MDLFECLTDTLVLTLACLHLFSYVIAQNLLFL